MQSFDIVVKKGLELVNGHPAFIELDVEDGTKYCPSNGTEGDIFMSHFCFKCIRHPISSEAKTQCRILMKSFFHKIHEKEYPKQWRYKNGRPLCTSFKSREEEYKKRKLQRKTRKKHLKKSQGPDLFD